MSKITAEELERRRRLGVERVREGHSQAEVAHFLGVTRSAVCKWVKAARIGPRGLRAKPGRGRPAKLSRQREQQVLRWFQKPATNFGFANELWTAPRVAQVIRRKWKVQFHPRYINQWLAERRITPQKPRRQPRQRDDDAIQHWVRYVWPRLKNEPTSCARISFLIDESGMLMAPLVRRSLAPSGQTPVLKQHGLRRDKVSLSAALCLSPRKQRLSLYFCTYPKQHVNGERTAEFLWAMLRQVRGRVIVVWDQGTMHKGPFIRALLRRFPRLELHSLPPYAPELNPVEQLWNHLKYHRFVNHAPLDVASLNQDVRRHLHRIRRNTCRLRSFFAAADLPFD